MPPVEVGVCHPISIFVPVSMTVTPNGAEGRPYITMLEEIGDQSPHPKIFSALYLAQYGSPLESPEEIMMLFVK